MLSQKTRHALQAMLEPASGAAGATRSSAAISAQRTIPVKFLAIVPVLLKRSGLIRGPRGRGTVICLQFS